jgi:Tfp pilus assembly protein PilN
MNDVSTKLMSWWETLITSLASGAEGLGAYLDRQNLTLVQLRKNLSGVNPENFLQVPYEPDNLEGVLPALKEIVSAWKVAASPVSLAVSPDFSFLQPASLPAAASENLAQVVAYELERFLPLPAAQLYYDFQVIRQTETEVHFMLLATPRGKVEPWLKILKEADLRPIGLELAPLAAANAIVSLAGKKFPASWLLLQMMPDAFELTHIDGQVVRSFFKKRKIQRKDLLEAIQSQIGRIVKEGPEPATLGVFGTPKTAVVNGLRKHFQFDVVPLNHLLPQEFLGEGGEGERLAALGAAVSSLEKPALGRNLLPLTEREPVTFKKFSLINSLFLAFLTLCLIWAGSALFYKRYRLFQVNRQIIQLTPEAREVENLLKEGRDLAQQLGTLGNIGVSPDKLVILKNLTQIIPDNTWLYNLNLSKQVLEISGISQSASELIPLLEKSGWLQKTEFVSPIVTDAIKSEHFKIKAEIKRLEPASQ